MLVVVSEVGDVVFVVLPVVVGVTIGAEPVIEAMLSSESSTPSALQVAI